MEDKIKRVFESNSKLIELTDKAVYYFRTQEYDKALGLVADSMEGINEVVTSILNDPEYFQGIKETSVNAMIEGILFAKRQGDYVLLADIYELQLGTFVNQMQSYIIAKEPFSYSMENYEKNLHYLEKTDDALYHRLRKPEEPRKLLDKGYAVEYSACGLMTMAGVKNGNRFYFHSNSHVKLDAFLLAKAWMKPGTKRYYIYGLGFGYHIEELMQLEPEAEIFIYESSFDVVRLTCNFVDLERILEEERVHLTFDESVEELKEAEKNLGEGEVLCVHYPSYRNEEPNWEFLKPYLSWLKVLEDCR